MKKLFSVVALCVASPAWGQQIASLPADSVVHQATHAYVGHQFITRGNRWGVNVTLDNKAIKHCSPGAAWECVAVLPMSGSLREPVLVLRSKEDNEEKVVLPLRFVWNQHYVYSALFVEEKRLEYGDEFWWEIMAARVKCGMSAEMCRQALGEPTKITPVGTDLANELWTYADGSTVHLMNGKVVSNTKKGK